MRRRLVRFVATSAAVALAVAVAGCSSGGRPGFRGGKSFSTPVVTSGPSGGANGPGGSGSNAQRLGAKWDWSRYEAFVPYLTASGGGSTFVELVWCDVEPNQGQPDWSAVDRVAQRTAALGYTLALKIRVGTCWATGGRGQFVRGSKGKTESGVPLDMAAYRAFVRSAVSRYAPMGVHEYAVENEVNSQSMWAGTPDQLISLVTQAAAVIRATDSSAVVVDPGISSTAYGAGIASRLLDQGRDADAVAAYQRYYARRFSTRGAELPQVSDVAGLRRALAGQQAQRNLAYLAVAARLARDGVVDVRQLHFYESWDSVPDLMAYLRSQLPTGMPVEAWEVGMFWTDAGAPDSQRGDEVVKTVSELLAGGVRKVLWLPLAFDPTGRHSSEPRYGLLDPSGAPRAGGLAYQALARAASGADIMPLQGPRFSGVAFGHGKSTMLVLWSSSGTAVPLPAAGALLAVPGDTFQPSKQDRVPVGPGAMMVKVPLPLAAAVASAR